MCSWIDIAIPWDGRVRGKKEKKLDKQEDLAIELQRVWQGKANVEPDWLLEPWELFINSNDLQQRLD